MTVDNKLILSQKYKAFLKCKAPVEFLEGTTAAGKTTVGVFKFILKCAESPKKIHILSGLDLGTIEKNIINKDLGIIDDFGLLTEYNAAGKGQYSLPHIVLHTSSGDKIIYVLGYDNKARWKKALGGQYGCLYIDEINIADMEYVREASMRCDYLIATLNPDDPNLSVYKEYINCSRPLPEWQDDTPQEILNMLSEEPKPNWVHWFFSFAHNAGLTAEKIEQIKLIVPKGTKLWKNKILGLRGRATGLVFSCFEHSQHIKSKQWANQFIYDRRKQQTEYFTDFSAGLDTAYSQMSPDTIAMAYIGITNKGKCIVLDEKVYNNADMQTPIAPSDTVTNFIDFLERNRKTWGFARNVFIDSADQATITELNKHKRLYGSVYEFNNAWKKVTIIDRLNMQIGWMVQGSFYVLDQCPNYINELDIYSWRGDKDNTPEDGNDHMINAVQYAFIPYKLKIGGKK